MIQLNDIECDPAESQKLISSSTSKKLPNHERNIIEIWSHFYEISCFRSPCSRFKSWPSLYRVLPSIECNPAFHRNLITLLRDILLKGKPNKASDVTCTSEVNIQNHVNYSLHTRCTTDGSRPGSVLAAQAPTWCRSRCQFHSLLLSVKPLTAAPGLRTHWLNLISSHTLMHAKFIIQ